jgi:uncharacterized membrane protein
MGTGRLEAFSDGVIAIIITIMVLELKAPEGASFQALLPLLPVFASYVLSFAFVGIYWNNHHHMLSVTEVVSGAALWANLHLLFWLSLIPFVTAWMDENHFATAPVAAYGAVLMMAGIAYYILAHILVRANGPDCPLARALGRDVKGKLSVAAYAAGIVASLWQPWVALLLYVAVAIGWFVPDRRVENTLKT